MTKKEAQNIAYNFSKNNNPTEEEIFIFTEAMNYLIKEDNNPEDMMYLGGVYYEMRNFDLALKYYEMAASMDYTAAYECLGYIWYYGRTGEKDYKKAFEYFTKASERGDIIAKYKLADMYKNGYYVEQNPNKYEEIIEKLYKEIQSYKKSGFISLDIPLPEVYTRLAKIKKDKNKTKEAINLYLEAKSNLAERIKINAFFGNLNIMMWLIDDLYEISPFDENNFDFYDLYYLLKNPHRIKFRHEKKEYLIDSQMEGNVCTVKFGNKWFHDRREFFENATINNTKLTDIYNDLYGFEVVQ